MIENNKTIFNVMLPCLQLRRYIPYYNIVCHADSFFSDNYTLMPDASGTISISFDGINIKAEVWGASKKPLQLGAETNKYLFLLLIELSPYGLYQLTGYNQSEIADMRFPLDIISKEFSTCLCNAVEAAENISELVNLCDSILLKQAQKYAVSNELIYAVEAITANSGQLPVRDLVSITNYSERHLTRLFKQQVGMNVKTFSRLVRFNGALRKMQLSPCFFASLSQQAGFSDQSHFIKDFKSICGITPDDYMKKMSDSFYDTSKI